MSQTVSAPSQGSNAPAPPPTSNVRMIVLLTFLILAIGALFYDYKVARPAVEQAYAKIQALNEEMNSQATRKATTNVDVQNALGKRPALTETHGPYQVEVYHFSSGLPLRPHKYYAVYSNGLGDTAGALVLMKHYAFAIPEDDLLPPSADAPSGGSSESPGAPEGITVPSGGPPVVPGMPNVPRPEETNAGGSASAPSEGKEEGSTPPASDENQGAAKESSAESAASDPPATDNPSEEKPSENKSAPDKPEDKPAGEAAAPPAAEPAVPPEGEPTKSEDSPKPE